MLLLSQKSDILENFVEVWKKTSKKKASKEAHQCN